jgi:hypothetical protein
MASGYAGVVALEILADRPMSVNLGARFLVSYVIPAGDAC